MGRLAREVRQKHSREATPLDDLDRRPDRARVDGAKPHNVRVGRELLREHLADFPRLQAIVADRGYRGLAKPATRKQLKLDIKAKPPGTKGFTPIGPLWRVEHAFAQLGRWRRLARCYKGSEASAKAWLEVASVGYLLRASLKVSCFTHMMRAQGPRRRQ